MSSLEFCAEIAAPLARVWSFYDDIQTLPRITPPETKIRIIEAPARLDAGARILLIVMQPPIYVPLKWETIIREYRPPELFVDEQGAIGPFAYWRHEHRFEDTRYGTTRIRDIVTYEPPLGWLGAVADHLFLRRQLTAMFAYRHRRTRELLETATGASATPPPLEGR